MVKKKKQVQTIRPTQTIAPTQSRASPSDLTPAQQAPQPVAQPVAPQPTFRTQPIIDRFGQSVDLQTRPTDPTLRPARASLSQQVAQDPSQFGLLPAGAPSPTVPEQPGATNPLVAGLLGQPEGIAGQLLPPPEQRIGLGLAAGVAGVGALAFSAVGAGGAVLTGQRAVQAGTAVKNTKAAGSVITKIRDGSIALGALIFGAEKFSDIAFNREVDAQQQGLNTLGQITSSIVGDSRTGAGDFQKGIVELNNLKIELLSLEQAIKAGTIKEATLKFRGEIIDINADIFDQLATIDEGIRDLQSFALQGQFPEMSEFDIQMTLRELEAKGHLKPVDLTESRRETS